LIGRKKNAEGADPILGTHGKCRTGTTTLIRGWEKTRIRNASQVFKSGINCLRGKSSLKRKSGIARSPIEAYNPGTG